jgi:hypothetical protein
VPHRLRIEAVQHRRAQRRTTRSRVPVAVNRFALALRFDFPINFLELARLRAQRLF